MENLLVSRYLRILEPLGVEVKLELIARLTESIKRGFKKSNNDKQELLNELCGSWSDVSDDIITDIYDARSSSDRGITFD
jgi:hypothetical protein